MQIVTESNDKLRKICQRPDSCHRYFSLPITRFILSYNLVTPTQVTVIDFFIGLAGCVILFLGKDWSFIAGTILMQLFEIFDCVDGEVARYLIFKGRLKRTKSETKVIEFIQDIIHPILQPLMFLGFGFGLYVNYHNLLILIISYVAAIGTSTDTYINTIREKLLGFSEIRNVSRAYKKLKSRSEKIFRFLPFGRLITEILTFVTPIPGVITMLNLAAILDLVFFPNMGAFSFFGFQWNFKILILIFYGLLEQVLWFMNAKLSVVYLQK